MNNDIKQKVHQINFLALQQYLTGKKWQKQPSKKGDKAFFRQFIGDNVISEIALPLNRNFSDYDEAIIKAINLIADNEQRAPIQIINDLLLPPADQIRFRVNNARTKDGLISLSEGFMLFESAKKSLLATAHDLLKPEVYHKRLGLKDAQQFIDSCMMGQTERGSFIASIVCPIGNHSVDDNYQQLSLFNSFEDLTSSFTRQVTTKLMNSISTVKQVIEAQNYSYFENNSISGNFLESLIEMGEYGESEEIQIMTSWAPTAPQLDSSVPNSVIITKDYILPLEQVVERIRERNADEVGEFVGRISEIKADPDIKLRSEGMIIFNCIGEYGAIKAKVILNKDDFHNAVIAFEEGNNIIVKGMLRANGRIKVIENPEFEIIT
jgi:hypothetical protein